jgi:hypothetical protein
MFCGNIGCKAFAQQSELILMRLITNISDDFHVCICDNCDANPIRIFGVNHYKMTDQCEPEPSNEFIDLIINLNEDKNGF